MLFKPTPYKKIPGDECSILNGSVSDIVQLHSCCCLEDDYEIYITIVMEFRITYCLNVLELFCYPHNPKKNVNHTNKEVIKIQQGTTPKQDSVTKCFNACSCSGFLAFVFVFALKRSQ